MLQPSSIAPFSRRGKTGLKRRAPAQRVHSSAVRAAVRMTAVLLLLAVLSGPGRAYGSEPRPDSRNGGQDTDRRGRFLSIFNIISFPNNVCNSTVDKTGQM
jgi:hypothetical protein